MTSLRRHLASLGLTMVLCHLVLQVLVPAALCCHQASASRAQKSAVKDCCPQGSHPGQVCPLHGVKRATQSATDCRAESHQDFRDLIIVLNSGGELPSPMTLTLPTGSELAFVAAEPQAMLVSHVPPGPPPRI
jgi:hypothetical protein